jgi:fused signal recognition particle receptor
MGFFQTIKTRLFGKSVAQSQKYRKGMTRSRSSFGEKLNAFFARYRTLDASTFAELEELLITADVGVSLAHDLIESLQAQARLQQISDPRALQEMLLQTMHDAYLRHGEVPAELALASSAPSVYLMVGVNGVGKTTTIAKLAQRYLDQGRSVMLVAGDTFRAGAIEQLVVWGRRLGIPVHVGKEQADPASVLYDGVRWGKQQGMDIILCDTAGRLQTKVNLMNELSKIHRVIQKEIPEGPHEVLLVLDATTGQNGIQQAKAFAEATGVTGLILTKMDGTAKGGIVLAIREQFQIPVRFIGLGEQLDDLVPFDLDQYLAGLFGLYEEEETR